MFAISDPSMSFQDSLGKDADLASLTEAQHPTGPQVGRAPLSAASRLSDLRADVRADPEAGCDVREPRRELRREKSEFQQLLAQALKALARREHSTVELKRKLHGYLDRTSNNECDFPNQAASQTTDQIIDQIIEALVLDGSLSDERFAAEFVRSRIQKGYGPIRIRMDLLERGIPDRLAEDELTRPTEFWQQQAADVCLRKFGHGQGLDQDQGQATKSLSSLPRANVPDLTEPPSPDSSGEHSTELDDASPEERRQLSRDRKEAAQRRWNRCARFLSQRGFPADLIYRTLDGRLLD